MRTVTSIGIAGFGLGQSNVGTWIKNLPAPTHMIRKGQLSVEKGKERSFAEQFYALAA